MSESNNSSINLTDQQIIDGLTSDTLEEYSNDTITTLQVSLAEMRALRVLNIPNATILSSANQSCYGLQELNYEPVVYPNNFLMDKPITSYKFKKLEIANNSIAAIGGGFGAVEFDFEKVKSISQRYLFTDSFNLFSLIFRYSQGVINLTGPLFRSVCLSPIPKGYGWIYVPDALVQDYKEATNWSEYATQIVGLSEYPKPLQGETITDSWDVILQKEASGDYLTDYHIGDCKCVKFYGIPTLMQIVAFDTDDLADDSGKAKITWMSKFIIYRGPNEIPFSFNPTGKWCLGGSNSWEDSCLRRYLQARANDLDFNSTLPNIKDGSNNGIIKPVKKKNFEASSAGGGAGTQTITTDTLWAPSVEEVCFNELRDYRNPNGCYYPSSTQQHFSFGYANAYAVANYSYIATRTAYLNTPIILRYDNGSMIGSASMNYDTKILFGFCT